mgnify:CR=1 FL=1
MKPQELLGKLRIDTVEEKEGYVLTFPLFITANSSTIIKSR